MKNLILIWFYWIKVNNCLYIKWQSYDSSLSLGLIYITINIQLPDNNTYSLLWQN